MSPAQWINFVLRATKQVGNYHFQISNARIHQIVHPFFFTSRNISAKVPAFHSSKPLFSHTPNPTPSSWPSDATCNMLTTATSSVRPGVYSFRTIQNVITPPHPIRPLPLTVREHVQHVWNKFRGPCVVLVKDVITPRTPPDLLLTVKKYLQHVNHRNKFRAPCAILVKNVITPAYPNPPVDHTSACATCSLRNAYCRKF